MTAPARAEICITLGAFDASQTPAAALSAVIAGGRAELVAPAH